jgi:uncharacterized membrane protein
MYASRRVNAVAVGLMAVAALAGLVLWPSLPDQMAIHWSGSEPDSYVAKPVGVFGLFAVGVATVAFVRLAPDSVKSSPGGDGPAVLFVGVVVAWVQGIVYAWNLGYRFDVGLAVVPVLVGAGLLVVYATTRGD